MLRPLSPSQKASLEEATARYQSHVGQAEEYLAGRGISLATAENHRLGVVVDPIPGHEGMRGRLAIPSLGNGDSVHGLRFRSLSGAEPKVLGLPGVPLRLFNVRALHLASDTVHITEGETDAMSLTECGLYAVGVTGATAGWKPHHARLFAGFHRVYVWPDGDEAGGKMSAAIEKDIDAAIVVAMPSGMDVNAILVEQGKDAILGMAC